MSCDLCDTSIQQQQRGRPTQRIIQGRPRRQHTTSPPRFTTNSNKTVGCKVCAPYYSNKVSKRSVLQTEVRLYNKSFAGKSASVAVQELCGDWYQSPVGSAHSSRYSMPNDVHDDDDISNQMALSALVKDDITLLQNLYGGQSTEVMQSAVQHSLPDRPVSAVVQAAGCPAKSPRALQYNFSFAALAHAGPFTGASTSHASTSHAVPQSPDFSFPFQSSEAAASNPLASVHLWPRTADSVMAHDTGASMMSRPGHVCEALASYSQMFSASWMPQPVVAPEPVPEMSAFVPAQQSGPSGAVVDGVDEDFEHLSQMSEQDWFEMQQVVEDDYVLV